MNSNSNRPDPRASRGQAPAQGPRPNPSRPVQGESRGAAPQPRRPLPQGDRPVPPAQAPRRPAQAPGHPALGNPAPGNAPRRRPPLTPEQRAAREQARKKREQRARVRGALTLGALILLVILLVTGIAKCAIGSGTPGGDETSSLPSTSGPIQTPGETEADPSDTEPSTASPPQSSPGTSAPVTDPPVTQPPVTQAPVTPPPTVEFTLPESVQSRYILLVNRTTGEVIYEKNADATAYPASITKIMTVLVALEELADTNGEVTITQDLIDRLRARGAARAGFFAGEKVKAKDLMYAALLPSGADGSVGLAELVAGSEEEFAKLMNAKAKELGMNNTRFVNATGLHEDEHYSSCRDLYLLLNEALNNDLLRTIFTTESYRTDPTNVHDAGIWMRSTMFRYLEEEKIERDYFLGGKTGYTGQAGVCLASLSQHDGNEYVLITLGAGNGDNHPRYQVHDAVAILDAYFTALG